jgi:hypothetical protein
MSSHQKPMTYQKNRKCFREKRKPAVGEVIAIILKLILIYLTMIHFKQAMTLAIGETI